MQKTAENILFIPLFRTKIPKNVRLSYIYNSMFAYLCHQIM